MNKNVGWAKGLYPVPIMIITNKDGHEKDLCPSYGLK